MSSRKRIALIAHDNCKSDLLAWARFNRDTRGLPAPAKGEQAKYILERVAELSQPFGTKITVNADTAQVVVRSGM